MATKAENKILQDIQTNVAEIKQGLYGVPDTDDRGMYGDVKDLCKQLNNLKSGHNKLKLVVYSLIGSGALGTGIWGLIS